MSSFTDWMIDDGFTDPQEYMDYLENRYVDSYENDSFWEYDDDEADFFDDEPDYDDEL